jgi:hypothetical protein
VARSAGDHPHSSCGDEKGCNLKPKCGSVRHEIQSLILAMLQVAPVLLALLQAEVAVAVAMAELERAVVAVEVAQAPQAASVVAVEVATAPPQAGRQRFANETTKMFQAAAPRNHSDVCGFLATSLPA